MRMMRVLLLLLLGASLCACSAQLLRDRRDAPWDPKPGHALMEQIPAWDQAAARVCSGQLRDDQKRPGMSDRCCCLLYTSDAADD